MDRSNQIATPKPQPLSVAASIAKGGTGATNVYDAATNLGGINNTSLGAANGLAATDGTGQVPSTSFPAAAQVGVTLNGVATVSPNQVVSFQITNFDTLTTYAVSVTGGTAALNGDTITYTAPSVQGNYTLTINGKAFVITVGVSRPAKPVLSAVTSGNTTSAILNITGSTYSSSTSVAQRSADWEVYLDAALTNLATSSLDDTVNKAGWDAKNLAFSTTYYARGRYRDINNQVSDWSNVISVTTAASYTPGTEEARLATNDPTSNVGIGLANSLTTDGSRILIAAVTGQNSSGVATGVAYIFLRNGASWVQEQKIQGSDSIANDFFGGRVSISGDGTRLMIGAYNATNSGSQGVGKVYIFVRNTTTNVWTQEQIIIPTTLQANTGNGVKMNTDGTRIAIASPYDTAGGVTGAGAVYVYTRSGTIWSQEQKLQATSPTTSVGYSNGIDMSLDGTRIVVGAYSETSNSLTGAGAVYVYVRSGVTWTLEQRFIAADNAASNYFGVSVAINSDATRMVVGAINTSNQYGAGYIFVRSGSTWSQEAKMVEATLVASNNFAASVCISGDGSTAAMSSYLDSTVLTKAGSVYVYSRLGSTWTLSKRVKASVPVANANFGAGLSLTPDGSRMAVGSKGETVGAVANAGVVYIER